MNSKLHDMLVKMFPYENAFFGRGGFEVNGLPEDAVPVGNILGRLVPKNQPDREFFLVDFDDTLFLLRICVAMECTGYAKFAVIHKTSLDTPPLVVRSIFESWKEHL